MTSWFTSKKVPNKETQNLQGLAAEKNADMKSMKHLLNNGADPYQQDEDGLSAFERSIYSNNYEFSFAVYDSKKTNTTQKELLKTKIDNFVTQLMNEEKYNEAAKIALYIKSNPSALKDFTENISKFEASVKAKGKELLSIEDDNSQDFIEQKLESRIIYQEDLLERSYTKNFEKFRNDGNKLSRDNILDYYNYDPTIKPEEYRVLNSKEEYENIINKAEIEAKTRLKKENIISIEDLAKYGVKVFQSKAIAEGNLEVSKLPEVQKLLEQDGYKVSELKVITTPEYDLRIKDEVRKEERKIIWYADLAKALGDERAKQIFEERSTNDFALYDSQVKLTVDEIERCKDYNPKLKLEEYKLLSEDSNKDKLIMEIAKEKKTKSEKILKINEFLDKKPFLGSSFKNSLGEELVNFALKSHYQEPTMLDKVVNLIIEQNPDKNSSMLLELVSKLNEQINESKTKFNPATLPLMLDCERLIRNVSSSEKSSKTALSSLAQQDINNLYVISNQLTLDKFSDRSFKASEIMAVHEVYSTMKWEDSTKSVQNIILNNISNATNSFINERQKDLAKFIKENNKEASNKAMKEIEQVLSNVSANNDLYSSFIKVHNESPEFHRDYSSIEEKNEKEREIELYQYFNSKFLNKLLGVDLDKKLNDDQLKNLEKFIASEPTLGNLNEDIGIVNAAIDNADKAPSLLNSLTDLVMHEHAENHQILGDFSKAVYTRYEELTPEEKKEPLKETIHKIANHLQYDNQADLEMVLNAAVKNKDIELFKKLREKNHEYQNLELGSEEFKILRIKQPDVAKSLLNESTIDHYLTYANGADHETVKFIYNHAQDKHYDINLNENLVRKLASALSIPETPNVLEVANLEKNTDLKSLIVNCAEQNGKDKFIGIILEGINQKDRKTILNDFIVNKEDENIQSKVLPAFAHVLLQDNNYPEQIESKEQLDELIKHYNPKEHSSKFLDDLLENQYKDIRNNKDIPVESVKAENFVHSVIERLNASNNIELSENKDAEKGVKAMAQRYFDKKRQYEKQPIWTRVKAFFQGYKLEEYKTKKLLAARDAIVIELNKDGVVTSPAVTAVKEKVVNSSSLNQNIVSAGVINSPDMSPNFSVRKAVINKKK